MVRGQDVGCGCDSWQQDLLGVLESAPSGHAMAGHEVVMIPNTTAITKATAVLIIDVDVPNRISVGNILRSPIDQHIRTLRH